MVIRFGSRWLYFDNMIYMVTSSGCPVCQFNDGTAYGTAFSDVYLESDVALAVRCLPLLGCLKAVDFPQTSRLLLRYHRVIVTSKYLNNH